MHSFCRRIILFLIVLTLLISCNNSIKRNEKTSSPNTPKMTPFEKNENRTATYYEVIDFYESLANDYPQLKVTAFGKTDSGHPLHEIILSTEKDWDARSNKSKGKNVLLINNAIHPGEPCGVDATMMLVRDYLEKKELQEYLKNTVIVVIPFYNIGGGLNRNSMTRANQDGPESYGFRGNAKNLDLNRDFIKCDSKNAESFNILFSKWKPNVFIDNHTSNGADYQYTMTLIATQHNKLDPSIAGYMNDNLLPKLYSDMESEGWEMTPYVYARETPDDGIAGFLDLPRYSSGYAALNNTISFMPETHMLKPFKDRVLSTYAFMYVMIKNMHKDAKTIKTVFDKAIYNVKTKKEFDINWKLNREKSTTISFKGYEAKYKPSEVSGLDRLYYDRNAPYEKDIPLFNTYEPTVTIEKPAAYIIPQAYHEIIERLRWNGVTMHRLDKDQVLNVDMYLIKDYDTRESAYEGHYLHSNVTVELQNKKWQYFEGDYIVKVDQASNEYIVQTLEPQGPDSFFAWNFFDGILMQKEYFSSYVFEDLAAQYLKEDPKLKKQLEAKRKEDPEFAKNAYAQLKFVYENSGHYEPTHNLYPVGRLRSINGIAY